MTRNKNNKIQLQKRDRNRELIQKRDRSPKKWTFEELGKYFGISPTSAFEIYRREKARTNGRIAGARIDDSQFIANKYPRLA